MLMVFDCNILTPTMRPWRVAWLAGVMMLRKTGGPLAENQGDLQDQFGGMFCLS